MNQIMAYVGYAIYADYDAQAPNTNDLILVGSEELAAEVLHLLNENPQKYYDIAFVDGLERYKSFKSHRVLREDPSDFIRSFEDVLKTHELKMASEIPWYIGYKGE
jgi:hypothetical protein